MQMSHGTHREELDGGHGRSLPSSSPRNVVALFALVRSSVLHQSLRNKSLALVIIAARQAIADARQGPAALAPSYQPQLEGPANFM
jgi:hypothetical protein